MRCQAEYSYNFNELVSSLFSSGFTVSSVQQHIKRHTRPDECVVIVNTGF